MGRGCRASDRRSGGCRDGAEGAKESTVPPECAAAGEFDKVVPRAPDTDNNSLSIPEPRGSVLNRHMVAGS